MLDVQRRLAAQILKCGENRIRFDPNSLEDIKEAITKTDIRGLINNGLISRKRALNTSRYWSRRRRKQKKKGKQKGFGSRKGRKSARQYPKRAWMNKIRIQRSFIQSLRDKNLIDVPSYRELYMKSKGGFFRSLRHLQLYTKERVVVKNEKG